MAGSKTFFKIWFQIPRDTIWYKKQRCEVAVLTATSQKCGSFKCCLAVKIGGCKVGVSGFLTWVPYTCELISDDPGSIS
jgi:hypothetical protein